MVNRPREMTVNNVLVGKDQMTDEVTTKKDDSSPDRETDGVVGSPKEAALRELMERTKYPIRQCNGQRRYGPPPGWEKPAPPRGCEVFVGKIPRDLYEDELVPVFEKLGKIYEIRLMMDFNGQNRGYAFVVYTSREDAKKCIKTMNNYEIRKGKCIGVCSSVDNCRLFVGGIPKKVKKDEIFDEVSKVTDCVVDVIVYPSAQDKTKNRGFAFVEYTSHRDAAMARRKLMSGKIQLWGHQIAVDWAEPEQEVDQDIMAQVKVLYARNLLLSTTEETIEEAFSKFGEVERVKKIKDYCFIHFRKREQALEALEEMNGSELDGNEIEVTLAKPVDKDHRQAKLATKAMMSAYGYMPYDYSPTFVYPYANPYMVPPPAPMTNGARRGAATGYNTNRGRGRGRSAAGSRSAGNKYYFPGSPVMFKGYYGGPGGGGRPGYYGDGNRKGQGSEEPMYDLLPGMELTPTNPLTLKPNALKSPAQILEDLCQKNQWGSPVYTLHSTLGPQDLQLFLYKISIPSLNSTYQPSKLCRNVDDAKNYAADYALQQLSVPLDAQDLPVTTVAQVPTTVTYQAHPMPPGPPYSIHSNVRPPADNNTYTSAFIPMSQAPTSPGGAVVAKMWPGGVPPNQDGNVYSNYDGYPEQQGYPQNIYQY